MKAWPLIDSLLVLMMNGASRGWASANVSHKYSQRSVASSAPRITLRTAPFSWGSS
jgi:hypothetical protein